MRVRRAVQAALRRRPEVERAGREQSADIVQRLEVAHQQLKATVPPPRD